MDTTEALNLVLGKMDHYGLIDKGWRFQWSRARNVFGLCQYNTKVIKLSKPLVELNSEAQVLDTILHETAHALAGPTAKHGPEWKEMARKLGARPEAVTTEGTVPPSKYFAICGCGYEFKRNRLPSAMRYCGKCYNAGLKKEARLMWVDRKTLREVGYSVLANKHADPLTQMAG